MTKRPGPRKFIKNNRGMVSADFIFSLVIAAGLSIVLFAMTFTFSMAEVAQYVVFSAARAYAAGHLDIEQQEKMGRDKFTELLKNSELSVLLANEESNWFILKNLELRGGGQSGKTFNDEYSGYEDRIPFVGARAEFVTKLLSLKLPFLGRTDVEGQGFSAKLTAFLIREPSQKECWDLQIKKRYSSFMDLNSRYQGSGTTNAASSINDYLPLEDNGC